MIFITGSTGLVGSHLLEDLLSKNYKIKALIRNKEDRLKFKFKTENVEWIVGDINDSEVIFTTLKDVKTVYHCAAIVSYSKKMVDKMHKVNVEGTANIVNACLENNVDKLCYISSIATLDPDKSNVISEKTHLNESNPHSEYAISKYYAELEVWRGIEEGLDCIILNPTIILGPSDWETSSTKLFKYVWDEHNFYIGGGYNFVDVRDVVNACNKLVNSNLINQQYIIAGETISYKLLFEKIAKLLDKKPPSIKATKFLKQLVLIWSNIITFFSLKEPLITKDVINKSDKTPIINSEKYKSQFSDNFYSIEDTIKWTCEELINIKNSTL